MMNISTFINMASKIPSPGQLEGLVTFMKEDEKLRFSPSLTGKRGISRTSTMPPSSP